MLCIICDFLFLCNTIAPDDYNEMNWILKKNTLCTRYNENTASVLVTTNEQWISLSTVQIIHSQFNTHFIEC